MSNSVEVSQKVVRDCSATVKKINSLLNSSKTRSEGLQLLNLFLPQCPDEDFTSFCISWMQNCCKVESLTNNGNCASRLLGCLLKTSSRYTELKKPVSFFITTRYFDFFFKYFINTEAGWTCTETCLLLYRGACGPFQEGLEKRLTDEIERNAILSSAICRCFALLPCAGGGGNDGVNFKRNWRSQFVKFLDVCHSILNDLFPDLEDIQAHETRDQNKNKQERNFEHLAVRLHNRSNVLAHMLLNQYPALKNIPSDLLFQLICRGLAVSPKAAGTLLSADAASLRKVLPDVHHSLVCLLKAAIVTCKNQLLPYSRLIMKLIKQSLQWTESEFTYENGKSVARLRTAAYETLAEWLTFARSGSFLELVSDVVVSSAVNDIRRKKGVVFLKDAKLQNHIEQTTRQVDASTDGKLCRGALRALQFLLRFTGVLINPEIHKFLQEVVVKLLVDIQRSPASDVDPPFDDPVCRSELYSLLLELVHQPSPKWPPPTNFALRLFRGGVNDVSPQVSSFCSGALSIATVVIHPQYDNGGFHLRDIRSTRQEETPIQSVTDEAVLSPPPVQDKTVQEETVEGNVENTKEEMNTTGVSEMSTDEDSRNTIAFSKDPDEAATEWQEEKPRETGKRKDEGGVTEEDLEAKRRRISAREKTPSPMEGDNAGGETPESEKTKKLAERNSTCAEESVSPEPTGEDSHPRGRYFLRSHTKGSSEEPEDTLKRTNSPDSSKTGGTPGKNWAKTPTNSKNKRRTRALSKAEGSTEADDATGEKTAQDEEEDIRAAFDDSFVD